ncbi:MAG: tetratricopeptide repeat protein [Acidiferrobacter sp.]
MSLINKVLRDLETRDRTGDETPVRPVLEGLRSAPPARTPSLFRYARIIAVAGAIIGIASLWLWHRATPVASSPPPARHRPPPGVGGARVLPSPLKVVPLPVPVVPVLVVPPAVHRPSPPRRVSPRPRATPLRRPQSVVSTAGAVQRHPAPVTPEERARADYRQAITALQHGHPHAAQTQLVAALAADPVSIAPRILLAALEVQDGRLAAAHRLLAVGLARHPQGLRAAMLQAQIDLRLQRPAAAVARLQAARVRGRGHKTYLSLLGAAAMQAHQWGLAHRAYHEGVHLYPNDGPLWVGLGLVDQERGDKAGARHALQRAARCPLSPVLAAFVAHTLARVRAGS